MNNLQQRKNEVIALLENKEIQDRITALCGSEVKKDKFKAGLLNIALDANLDKCSIQSIVKASLDIAELKLSLNKNLGKAYIVPRLIKNNGAYVTEARIDIGYKGWLELAKRNKIYVRTHSVFDCDVFKYSVLNSEESMEFVPNFDLRQDYNSEWISEHLKGIIVIVRDAHGSSTNFVSKGTLQKIMQKNDAVKRGKYSAYSEWLNEMLQAKAIKSVLSKTAMGDDIAQAVSFDNQSDNQDFIERVAPVAKPKVQQFDVRKFLNSNKDKVNETIHAATNSEDNELDYDSVELQSKSLFSVKSNREVEVITEDDCPF